MGNMGNCKFCPVLNSVKLVMTGLEVILQTFRAIRLFRYQVTLLRSLVILGLTMMKQDVAKSCTSCTVFYPIILGAY